MQADELLVAAIDAGEVAVEACAYLVFLGGAYGVVRLEEGGCGSSVVAGDRDFHGM